MQRARRLPTMVGLLAIMLSLVGTANDDLLKGAVDHPGRPEADRARDASSKPFEVLKFIGVQPGMKTVDIFAGSGYFSELLSHAVGEDGKVYLQNNQAWVAFVGKQIEDRLKDNRLPNVVRWDKEVAELKFPDEKLDLALMVMVYHDIYFESPNWKIDGKQLLGAIHHALKPGGMLVVIDHVAKPGTGKTTTQDLHRIDMDFAKKDIESAGFVFEAEADFLRNPEDDYGLTVFDKTVQGKTDRFVYKFRKSK